MSARPRAAEPPCAYGRWIRSCRRQPPGLPALNHTTPGREFLFWTCRMAAGPNVMGLSAHDGRPPHTQEMTMQYMLLIYANEAAAQGASKEMMEQTLAA